MQILPNDLRYDFLSNSCNLIEYGILDSQSQIVGKVSGGPINQIGNIFTAFIYENKFSISSDTNNSCEVELNNFLNGSIYGSIKILNNTSISYHFSDTSGIISKNSDFFYDYKSFFITDHNFGKHFLILSQQKRHILDIILNILLYPIKKPTNVYLDYVFHGHIEDQFKLNYLIITSFFRCCIARFDG